ncbi:MAG: ribosome biogenesis GTP-binding protein YihA/YsxC [Terrimicrobiaceae bacterium]|jgi:GTP-binding protein
MKKTFPLHVPGKEDVRGVEAIKMSVTKYVKITSAVFHSSSPNLASCPESDLPEFAFIGRSNVGKSSLINMLTRQEGLAKVSSTPGKTRLINFFTINNTWSLVDLPGYGYAKVAKKERGSFSAFVADYLQHRPNLLGTFALVDSRLSPQSLDLEFLRWMVGCRLPFVIVFTKADKLTEKAAQKNIGAFLAGMREISEEPPEFVLSSSKLDAGRAEILGMIASALTEETADSTGNQNPA